MTRTHRPQEPDALVEAAPVPRSATEAAGRTEPIGRSTAGMSAAASALLVVLGAALMAFVVVALVMTLAVVLTRPPAAPAVRLVGFVLAQGGVGADPQGQINQVFANIRTFLLSLVGGLILLNLSLIGFWFLWARDRLEDVERAKTILQNTIKGTCWVALAPIALEVFRAILGGVPGVQ